MRRVMGYRGIPRCLLTLLLACLPVLCCVAAGVDTLSLVAKYPTVKGAGGRFVAKFDQAKLIFPGSHCRFDSLYAQLRAMQEQDSSFLNILHVGGSHVQAGHLSHQLRNNFDSLTPNLTGSRGLLFPWQVMKTNGPTNYTISHTGVWTRCRCLDATPAYPLGLSGAAACTCDTTATLTVQLGEGSEKWAFRRLLVLGECPDGDAFPVLVTAQGDTLLPGLDRGQYAFELPAPATACTVAFQGLGAACFVLRGLFPETGMPGITYTECGVNGASLPSWLKCPLWQQELASICPPHLLILGVGINDANVPVARFDAEAFKENYRQLIHRARQANPAVAIIFLVNNDCWLRYGRQRGVGNRNTKTVEQCMLALAKEFDAAVFSQFAVMGGYGSSNTWVRAGLMNRDHIHFTASGYRLMADLLFHAFLSDFNSTLQCASEPES